MVHETKVNPLVIKGQKEMKGQSQKEMKGQREKMKGQLDRKGQYEVKGQGQNESHQIGMSDQIMNCLRKLPPSKFIQKMGEEVDRSGNQGEGIHSRDRLHFILWVIPMCCHLIHYLN